MHWEAQTNKNFLNEDKQNKVLYHEWKNCGNEKALEELTEKFKYFVQNSLIQLYKQIIDSKGKRNQNKAY